MTARKKRLRVLLVDDELPARRLLRNLLKADSDTEIIAECDNGTSAVESINTRKPDLVFLDIRMPGLDGFDVVRLVGPSAMPAVVFMTAYDEYAVKAFEINAVDYLLKPCSRPRFTEALARVRQRLNAVEDAATESPRLSAMLRYWPPQPSGPDASVRHTAYLQRFVVRRHDRLEAIPVGTVRWIEAADHYAILHASVGERLVTESLGTLEERLDPAHFIRIHRTVIVNARAVERVVPGRFGNFKVQMSDGVFLPISRRRREALVVLLGQSSGSPRT